MRPVYLQAVAIEEGTPAPDPRRFFPDQPRLARLDLPSRYVACAAGRLPAATPLRPEATAVILGSTAGCLDADLAFAASVADRPSPATYARTLPSTAGAELAILRGCRGPAFAIVQDGIPGMLALAAAAHEIAAGACDAAVAGEYDALSGPGGTGVAVLCLLGSEPAPDGRSRPLVVTRGPGDDPPGEGRAPAGLRALADAFERLPPDRPLRLEAAGSGSRVRVECGPVTTRCP